ncbi:MAG TPA: NTP transferase domain-containing protein, partial [Candidatus Binatia bacterium]|nr:NTP transferase domain-containing protein [Candidatus Binatia bacterium]
GRVPLVVVPTIFDQTTADEMQRAGAKIIIYANQPVRAAIRAMRETLALIQKDTRPGAANDRIVTLPEVYDIVGVPQMERDEKAFLPVGGENITAIIPAAGFEKQLLPLIEDKPKCLLDIKGKTILERAVGALNAANIKEIAVVRGYKKEAIALPNIRYYDNDRYEETGELFSIFCAESEMKGRTIILYGDIIFDSAILEKLLKSPADVTLVMDLAWQDQLGRGGAAPHLNPDLITLAEAPGNASLSRFVMGDDEHRIVKIGQHLPLDQVHGEFIGMAMFSEKGTQAFRDCYRSSKQKYHSSGFHEASSVSKASFTDLIQELIDQGHRVDAVTIFKGWMEVDSFEEYQSAWAKLRQ